jgi:hypothetical protein
VQYVNGRSKQLKTHQWQITSVRALEYSALHTALGWKLSAGNFRAGTFRKNFSTLHFFENFNLFQKQQKRCANCTP